MASNPPEGCQRIVPYIYYEDAPAAIDYLCKTFGFEEKFRFGAPDGKVGHAELALGGETLMLASVFEEMGHASPKNLPARHGLIMCYVDDVDAHHARAKEAGGLVVSDPEDQFYGDRSYRAEDPEKHQWYFAQHVRDVPMDEMMKHEG